MKLKELYEKYTITKQYTIGDNNDAPEDYMDFGEEEYSNDEDMGFEDEEDSNFEGNIRRVKGARLIYKKQNSEGTYNELWIFTTNKDAKKDMMTKRNIIKGTNIDPVSNYSQDGNSILTMTNIGNLVYVELKGVEI